MTPHAWTRNPIPWIVGGLIAAFLLMGAFTWTLTPWDGHTGMMGAGSMFMIVPALLLVLLLLAAFGAFPRATTSQAQTPREILDARLARGEITRQEYEEIRETIERIQK
jgi:uncharacterized membrane protein